MDHSSSNSTSTSSLVITPLGSDPTRNYRTWLQSSNSVAAGLMNNHYGSQGMLHFEWSKPSDQRSKEIEIPVAASIKDHSGKEKQAWAIEAFKLEMKRFNEYTSNYIAFKKALLVSIGTDNEELLSDPINGTNNVSINDIYTSISNLYGQLSAADLVALNKQLTTPFTCERSFLTECTKITSVFKVLAAAGHTKCNSDKISIIINNSANISVLMTIINNYETSHPELADREYGKFIEYINKQLVAKTISNNSSTNNYSNNANTSITSNNMDELVNRVIFAMNAQSVSNSTSSNAYGKRKPKDLTKYCFLHGYGHSGRDCITMGKNTGKYNTHMRNATAPCMINGQQGYGSSK